MNDLVQIVGIAGAPTVMKAVDWLKEIGMPKSFSPVASLVVGVLFNIVIAWLYGTDLKFAFGIGLFTGLTASGWYDVTRVDDPLMSISPVLME